MKLWNPYSRVIFSALQITLYLYLFVQTQNILAGVSVALWFAINQIWFISDINFSQEYMANIEGDK